MEQKTKIDLNIGDSVTIALNVIVIFIICTFAVCLVDYIVRAMCSYKMSPDVFGFTLGVIFILTQV